MVYKSAIFTCANQDNIDDILIWCQFPHSWQEETVGLPMTEIMTDHILQISHRQLTIR